MEKKDLIVIQDFINEELFSLHDLCDVCGIREELVIELITYDIIKPSSHPQDKWMFDNIQLHRLKTALRLQRDLEINVAGIALILDLLDELEQVRARAALLEKHFLKL